MLLFFISSCSFCIFIILSFFALSSFKFWASLIYCIYLFWFYCMILFLLLSRCLALFSSRCCSSSSLCYWSCNLFDLSTSFLYLILTTYSAFFLVSSIFFQAFFSSNFNKAILFANSLASSYAFFLFCLVATNAPVTSSWYPYCPSSSPYSYWSCCSPYSYWSLYYYSYYYSWSGCASACGIGCGFSGDSSSLWS